METAAGGVFVGATAEMTAGGAMALGVVKETAAGGDVVGAVAETAAGGTMPVGAAAETAADGAMAVGAATETTVCGAVAVGAATEAGACGVAFVCTAAEPAAWGVVAGAAAIRVGLAAGGTATVTGCCLPAAPATSWPGEPPVKCKMVNATLPPPIPPIAPATAMIDSARNTRWTRADQELSR